MPWAIAPYRSRANDRGLRWGANQEYVTKINWDMDFSHSDTAALRHDLFSKTFTGTRKGNAFGCESAGQHRLPGEPSESWLRN